MKGDINKGLLKKMLFINFLLSFLLLFCTYSIAQKDKQSLENKKKALAEDIEYQNKLLKETTTSKKISLGQLVMLNKKISAREELISTINFQIRELSRQIQETVSLVEAMEYDLQTLKDEYARMVYHAYKNRSSTDKLVFIFSSRDFNQAYKRLKYYEQYYE